MILLMISVILGSLFHEKSPWIVRVQALSDFTQQ